MSELYYALSISLWLLGSSLIVFPMVGLLSGKWTAVRRLRNLRRAYGTENVFSIYQYKWMSKFKELVIISGVSLSPSALIGIGVGMFVIAFFCSGAIVHLLQTQFAVGTVRTMKLNSFGLNMAVALLLGSTPFFYIFFKVQRTRQQIALCMISAVQSFIGVYNHKHSLADLITQANPTMPLEIKHEWDHLEMAIRTRPMKEALYGFARRIDNEWADDWADILLVKGEYGNDITKSMHKLVREMQTAKSNEQKRQAVISIYRIGTTLMVAAAFLIVGLNIYLDGNNYTYYFAEQQGKSILIISLLILFASLIAVILSGRKRI